MRMMALAMIVFLVAIARATFLESMYDIQTARLMIYNAKWFEMLLVYLGICLIANIIRSRMFKREKMAMLMFHLSFIVILIGAGVTRYVSFEGLMMIKEGQQSNFIFSSEPHVWFKINDGVKQYTNSDKIYMSEETSNHFSFDVDFPEHKTPITIEYLNFEKNRIDSLIINDSIQGTAFEIVTNGMQSNYLVEDDFLMIGDVAISFDKEDAMPGIEVFAIGAKAMMKTQVPIRYLPMAQMREIRQSGNDVPDSMYVIVKPDTMVPFQTETLYSLASGEQFVFKGIIKHAKMMRVRANKKKAGRDYLTVRITDGDKSTIISLGGGANAIPDHEVMEFNGLIYEMEYGSKRINLPFAVKCRDFQLDKYPGSDTPSSFASEVTIIDEEKNYTRDQRIFMNNVMDYRGYRFFQSSYDPDEKGTRLSVNHDFWGTLISYIGYLMMAIGMILSLFAPLGRFRHLNTLLKKSREKREKLISVFIAVLMLTSFSFGQSGHEGHNHAEPIRPEVKQELRMMTEEHSDELATLMVQDFQGRIVPMHTICDQLLRKVSRSRTYKEFNAVQTIMSMHMRPDFWMNEPIIYVSTKGGWRVPLKAKDGLVSFNSLKAQDGNFALLKEYQEAHQMREADRGEREKQLIKLGDKYQVADAIFSWRYMLFIPLESDANNKWYSPLNLKLLEVDTAGIKKGIRYLATMDSATADLKSYTAATIALNELKEFQYDAGKNVAPSKSTISMEVSYNKMNVFKNSFQMYGVFGLLILILFFIKIFINPTVKSEKRFKLISKIMTSIVLIIFLYHGYGLYMRMMISGHAPWSNGYEALIFISWVTVLTGLIFSKKNGVIIAGAAILAMMMIIVAEMELMDPEISPLQPVLKSFWLKIHVAIITGSYAPLGLSCILALLNLILYIFRTKKNAVIFNININELTYISELILTIGLFMLTIGTFLGGVWANESWGRYWGWDPKETWALVAVLVYAVILHLRYIPALKSKFVFNVVSFWGFASILFTFFGVNFYLVGLHSYANGESLGEFPPSLKYTILIFILFTGLAIFRNYQYKKSIK